MTPEQEIERIKREYKEHWHRLEKAPEIQQAVAAIDPIKLAEEAAKIVYGNIWTPTKQELENEMMDSEYYGRIERQRKASNPTQQ